MSLTKADLQAIRQITTETATEVAEKVIGKAISDLAVQVDDKITDLAIRVGEGFNEMSFRFDQVEAEIVALKTDMREVQ